MIHEGDNVVEFEIYEVVNGTLTFGLGYLYAATYDGTTLTEAESQLRNTSGNSPNAKIYDSQLIDMGGGWKRVRIWLTKNAEESVGRFVFAGGGTWIIENLKVQRSGAYSYYAPETLTDDQWRDATENNKHLTNSFVYQALDRPDINARSVALSKVSTERISGGAITVTGSVIETLNEGGASADDLDTLNGGVEGQLVLLRPSLFTQAPTVKNATGNIHLHRDFQMVTEDSSLLLIKNGSNWEEVTRSNNGTVQSLFTPSIQIGGSNTGITYTYQQGWYYYLDHHREVAMVDIHLTLSSDGDILGDINLHGLPFTLFNYSTGQAPDSCPVQVMGGLATACDEVFAVANPGGTTYALHKRVGTTVSRLGGADIGDAFSFHLQGLLRANR